MRNQNELTEEDAQITAFNIGCLLLAIEIIGILCIIFLIYLFCFASPKVNENEEEIENAQTKNIIHFEKWIEKDDIIHLFK